MATRALSEFQPETREWFTAAELAELALPGLPGDKRSINRRAQEERWSMRHDSGGALLVRPRPGRGGGVEFHVSLLPGTAQLELSRRGLIGDRPAPVAVDMGGWRWYEGQSGKVKAEAERRLRIVRDVEMLRASGMGRTAAVAEIAYRSTVGVATIGNYLAMIRGIAPEHRLPALAPRRKGGGCESEIDPLLWTAFKSDFLRPSAPTLSSCYERTCKIAEERGLSIPSERTMRRRLEREVDPRIIKLRREGEEALRRSIPAQRRTVMHLHALEHVNIDGHRFDVFVRTPEGKVIRPTMVAIQDIFSSKFVAWRVGETESAVQTRLCFADLFQAYGIPKACTLDNGRAFASKWITGGVMNRYRFKVREDEPTGLLTALGIEIHWALPYRGQSKPIERAFRDLCDSIAKHPAMEGAYTGNNPMAKPENYGSCAIEWDVFIAHVDQGMLAHNARLGRRGRHYSGRSFDQVFAESIAAAPIGKATPEHLRMALLTADQVRVDKNTGEIGLFGNRYWSEDCGLFQGQRVTVRFDPDNLMQAIHVYSQDGLFLTSAELIADNGFDDVAGAIATKKRLKAYRDMVRKGAEAEMLMAAEEVAALQSSAPAGDVPTPSVIRAVRHRGQTAAALKAETAPALPAGENKVLNIFGRLRPLD